MFLALDCGLNLPLFKLISKHLKQNYYFINDYFFAFMVISGTLLIKYDLHPQKNLPSVVYFFCWQQNRTFWDVNIFK